MSLRERYGMGKDEQRQRQEFLGIGQDDERNVRALRDIFADFGEEFARRFYDHLLAHEHTREFLRDEKTLAKLQKLQVEYFDSLLAGRFDDDYFESRLRVGQAHQRVGLEPAWYLGAYNQYVQLSFPHFAQALGKDPDRFLPLLLSLVKVIFLDIGLALDTYFFEATEQLRSRNHELQQALALYWQSQRREEQLRKLVSHEVRGGLAAVITSLEDLQETIADAIEPSDREELKNVVQRCWSLSNLLKEMLAPQAPAGPMWVDTAEIFESLASRFQLYTGEKQVQLQLPEHPPRVWADPVQLREVFANLVANAVRYLDKDPGKVTITAHPDGEFVAFCVADNGPGIPDEWQTQIFEPFVRGPAAAKSPEGTGLGLSFVRSAVEQAGGRVWVESKVGEGSRFWFTVPRVSPEQRGGH